MSGPGPVVSVGARGWRHAGWCGGFYPDDLPEDWQLDFYANEFRQLLLPWVALQAAGDDDVGEWAGAVDAGFRFFVELPSALTVATAKQVLLRTGPLGSQLAGLCADDGLAAEVVALLGRRAPVFMADGRVPLAPFGSGRQWLPLAGAAQSGSVSRLLVADSPDGHTALELRGCVESLLLDASAAGETLLFFAGEPPVVADMRLTRQLAELLG